MIHLELAFVDALQLDWVTEVTDSSDNIPESMNELFGVRDLKYGYFAWPSQSEQRKNDKFMVNKEI